MESILLSAILSMVLPRSNNLVSVESVEYMKADEVKSLIRSANFSFRKKRKTETDGEYRDAFDRKAMQLYRTLADLPTNNLGEKK